MPGDTITIAMHEGDVGITEYFVNTVRSCHDGLLEISDISGKRHVVNMRSLAFVRATLEKK